MTAPNSPSAPTLPSQARYVSQEEKYGLYNFHRRDSVARAMDALTSPAEAPVLLLSGETGTGRSYFAEAVAWSAGSAVLTLDLEGFEDGAEGVVHFLELQAEKRQVEADAPRQERLEAARKLAESLAESSLPVASLVSLVLSWTGPVESLRSCLGQSLEDLPGPRRNPREALRLLLDHLSRPRRLLLHVENSAQLNAVLRRWLLDEAKRNPNLVLALSCQPKDRDEDVAPRSTVLRLEFAPLTAEELRAVLDANFEPHQLPPELDEALVRYGHGLPSQIALKMQDLVREEIVVLEQGVWRLGEDGMESEALAEQLSAVLLEPLRDLLADLDLQVADRVERFLDLAALCGENVPAELLLAHMELDKDERDEILDVIDESLVEAQESRLFVDHQFGHPSFRGLLTYSFVNPVLVQALLAAVPQAKRQQLASELLASLRDQLPAVTRGIARLFLALADHLENAGPREELLRQLAWWVGQDEDDELGARVLEDLKLGSVSPDTVLAMVDESRSRWPPHRRLALLDALTRSPEGVPRTLLGNLRFLRGGVLCQLGRFQQALDEAQAALPLVEEEYGPEAPQTGPVCNLVGLALDGMGRPGEALPWMERALRILRQASTASPEIAMVLMNLGVVRHHLQQPGPALADLEEALEVSRALLGERTLQSATILSRTAPVLERLGSLERAVWTLEEALAIFRETLGPRHPEIGQVLSSLGMLHLRLGAVESALSRLHEGLYVLQETLGPRHPLTLQNLANLGSVAWQLGDLKQAREALETAITVEREILGERHPAIALHLSLLAAVLGASGDPDGRRAAWREALDIARAAGPRPELAANLAHLGQLIARGGEDEEARGLLQEAAEIYAEGLGEDHPATVLLRDRLRDPGPSSDPA